MDVRRLAVGFLLLAASSSSGCFGDSSEAGQGLRVVEGRLEFPAVVDRHNFERELLGLGMPGYHYVVWDDGRSAPAALFRSQVSDVEVLAAFEKLGLVPGNALGMDVWDDRHDAEAEAPDRLIEGPRVAVLVRLPDSKVELAPGDILDDPGGRGFDMRFGGHAANIGAWHSGCVVCLFSCPGSKVGNRTYTVRDYVQGTTRFRVREGVLPEDGTEVTVILAPL